MQIVPPPPEILTVGLAPLIPVKADVWPDVIVAPAAKSVLLPIAIYFTQGLVDWLKVPFNCAELIEPSVPFTSDPPLM